ncbi:serine/arginine-rich splicing factor 7 isoform X3 [Dermochelys coriacea]|uniref:serine/arginine-rich splicing factor 7 isoform X3 n=1 Tax=Dermochelys coriacea TaxID=27794 RepID=UPI001CA9C0B1|nr:serine/arginine-rich splicing factor 7 isoform X3 [Dermochelys coriacea]
MSRYGRYGGETKVYVGNLGTGAGKGELERAFSYYGPLRTVWIARNPPGFAFVEFEDPRDAEDAVRGLDGKVICGSRVRVELSTGMPRRSRYDRPPARRPFDPNDRCYECGEKGHYAYDCHRYSRRRRSRSRSRSHSRSRGRRYSRSRSRSRGRRSRSASLRRSRSVSPRRSRSASPRRSRSGSLKRSSFSSNLDLDPDHDQDPGPLHGQEAADQSPDRPLQREVAHHQEALEGGVQVL